MILTGDKFSYVLDIYLYKAVIFLRAKACKIFYPISYSIKLWVNLNINDINFSNFIKLIFNLTTLNFP